MPGGGKRTEAEPDIPEFTEGQKAEVRAGCYELLLVLAEVAAHRRQGQKADDLRAQVKRAVGLLDRAAQLGDELYGRPFDLSADS